MPWTQIDRPVVVVPVGSCEQHGPHLPGSTDTIIATALARRLVSQRGDAVLAPAIAVSASGEHAGFAGTLSIGLDVMEQMVIELVRSADWSAGVVLVNGHGGNKAAIDRAVGLLDSEGRAVLSWWPVVTDGDPHAGRTETSIMMAIEPELVDLDRAVVGPVPPIADLMRYGVRSLSRSGVLGDPTEASAEQGQVILDSLAEHLVSTVSAWLP